MGLLVMRPLVRCLVRESCVCTCACTRTHVRARARALALSISLSLSLTHTLTHRGVGMARTGGGSISIVGFRIQYLNPN
jgi:hypothetical protein